MRKAPISSRVLLTLLAGALCVAASAALAQDDDDSIVIGKKRQIESKILEESRELWISTPASYQVGEERYPVLYVLDGNAHLREQRLSLEGQGLLRERERLRQQYLHPRGSGCEGRVDQYFRAKRLGQHE